MGALEPLPRPGLSGNVLLRDAVFFFLSRWPRNQRVRQVCVSMPPGLVTSWLGKLVQRWTQPERVLYGSARVPPAPLYLNVGKAWSRKISGLQGRQLGAFPLSEFPPLGLRLIYSAVLEP